MCNWLAGALANLSAIVPANPADVAELSSRARYAERQLRQLSLIAGELGWHADASLDVAHELIKAYDKETP